MSTQDTNNPPAFPAIDGNTYEEGMSMRDYFAGLAMQASRSRDTNYKSWVELAKDSYEIADAMLKERVRTP